MVSEVVVKWLIKIYIIYIEREKEKGCLKKLWPLDGRLNFVDLFFKIINFTGVYFVLQFIEKFDILVFLYVKMCLKRVGYMLDDKNMDM